MKKNILAFVDLEATGLDPSRCEIIEIGIVIAAQRIDSSGNGFLELISEHNIQLIPMHIETADPKALEVNKYYSRDWSAAVSQKEGLAHAAEILRDKIFVAQNVGFDWAFIQRAGQEHGVDFDSIVHYHKLDLASMVFGKLYNDPALFKFSLREMTVYFDVVNDNAHTALADARATFEVCNKLLQLPS